MRGLPNAYNGCCVCGGLRRRQTFAGVRVADRFRRCLLTTALGSAIFATAGIGDAAVAVIANRTAQKARFVLAATLERTDRAADEFEIAEGETLTLSIEFSRRLTLHAPGADQSYTLSPNSAYVLVERASGLALRAIGLAEGLSAPPLVLPTLAWNAEPPAADTSETKASAGPQAPVVVPVKILVDDDERAARPVWEKRLRGRITAASQILQRDCGVKLQVTGVGSWTSDNGIQDFSRSLDEFERQVKRHDERLAIGFTSQYALTRGQTHLGGIHGPLATHLLLREWSQIITEPERLEVLLHELGHFLGAAHSPERDSVMRPVLADRRARAVKFRIGFDPLNTLVASLVGAQLQSAERGNLAELDLPTQLQLRPIHAELARAMPSDPTARRYVALADRGIERSVQAARPMSAAIAAAAADNGPRAAAANLAPRGSTRSPAELPLEERLQIAVKFAALLPADRRTLPCLLAVSLNGPARSIVTGHPLARPACDRIAAAPVAAGQSAAVSHSAADGDRLRFEKFLAAAALASLLGPQLAEASALAETGIADPSARTVDLTDFADRLAGIGLAERLAGQIGPNHARPDLLQLAEHPHAEDFLPLLAADGGPADGEPAEGKPAGDQPVEAVLLGGVISRAAFDRQFGSVADPRFIAYRQRQFEAIQRLPAFRPEAE
jgi:hypothetical protein